MITERQQQILREGIPFLLTYTAGLSIMIGSVIYATALPDPQTLRNPQNNTTNASPSKIEQSITHEEYQTRQRNATIGVFGGVGVIGVATALPLYICLRNNSKKERQN